MQTFEEGDRVRIDIPDVTDPDHNQYHGQHGRIVDVLVDDAGAETTDDRDNYIFRVRLDGQDTVDFRWRDLRPPIE